jgi:hypothetical protein
MLAFPPPEKHRQFLVRARQAGVLLNKILWRAFGGSWPGEILC